MQIVPLVLAIACAMILPRALGLQDKNSSVMEAAMWGGIFGAAGGLVGALLCKMFGKKP